MLVKSPVGSTHTEYVETMSTCSEAAFLVVTGLCVRGGRNSGPMPTAAHRVSITLAATSEFQGQLQEAGASTDESRGINEDQKRGNEIFGHDTAVHRLANACEA